MTDPPGAVIGTNYCARMKQYGSSVARLYKNKMQRVKSNETTTKTVSSSITSFYCFAFTRARFLSNSLHGVVFYLSLGSRQLYIRHWSLVVYLALQIWGTLNRWTHMATSFFFYYFFLVFMLSILIMRFYLFPISSRKCRTKNRKLLAKDVFSCNPTCMRA